MIKKLRKKFIGIAMLSLFSVLAIIISTINIINYNSIAKEADEILSLLASNDGEFPIADNTNLSQTPPTKPDNLNTSNVIQEFPQNKPPQDEQNHHENNPAHFHNMSPELPYESRFFSVVLSDKGEIIFTDTDNIAAIDSISAVEMASKICDSGKEKGFYDSYRYIVVKKGNETFVIFLDCRRGLATFKTFLTSSLLIAFTGLVAVFILIFFLSKKIVKPVSESYEKQKRFITDAGHEIKTPITIIDADAEVLEMELGDNEWIQDIRKQTKRLSSLTKDLIYLSRMEEENVSIDAIEFPVSDIVTETAESFQTLAIIQKKNFSLDIEPMLSMTGDEKSIRQLISILLDNALKYSTSNGSIELSLKKKNKFICLTVTNTTTDISDQELNMLFDRFYRGDKSRNSKNGGYGIGLSIAKAIVNAHKGKITASKPQTSSLSLTVILPE